MIAVGAQDSRAALMLAIASSPRDPELRRALGAVLQEQGELKAAFEQFCAALKLDPGHAEAAADAGVLATKLALEERALPLVKAAAQRHPNDARLWQVVGLLHRALEELEPAIAAFEKAARLDPKNSRIAHGRARVALEAGKPAAALFARALVLSPADAEVLLGQAAALYAEGRGGEAIAGLRTQLMKHPGWLVGHATLSRLLWMEGERETFTASFEQAILTAPRDVNLWRDLIVTLMHADLWDKALDAIRRGRVAVGPHLVFDVNEAVCFSEKGELDTADGLFAALRGIDEPTAAVRYVRHLLRSGRPQEAARVAERWTGHPFVYLFWPYLAAAWRLLADSRWDWLEGDPRFVGIYDIGGAIPSIDALAEMLRSLHVASHQPLEQSVRGGTQTDGPLFSRVEPEIRQLRVAIVEAVKEHVAQLPPPDSAHPLLTPRRDAPVRFSGSWSVRLQGKGHHANHIHPAGWLSSAFYVVLPREEERGAPHAGWLALGQPQAELALNLPPVRLIEPKPGRLVLFPSTMWHGTLPFERGERMTVAFDVAPPRG